MNRQRATTNHPNNTNPDGFLIRVIRVIRGSWPQCPPISASTLPLTPPTPSVPWIPAPASEEQATEESEEILDILGAPPRWIVRGGTGSVLVALILLVVLGAFIPYPETVSGRVVISRVHPPVGVVAPRSGRLTQWRVHAGQTVADQTILAVLDSAAEAEEVMTIVPADTRLWGRMLLKQAGVGKVRRGQTVRIRLDDFPAAEFGTVLARVEAVSSVPREGAYVITLTFASGLETSHGFQLQSRPELHGDASIVTVRASFLDRLLRQLLGRWKSLGC